MTWVLFLSVLAVSDGFQLHGSLTPISAQLGGSVLLLCAAESPLLLEEVEWRRADSGALLHLFREGEERPESQDQAYRGRAHFFTEEVARGNYSIMLHNVTMQDAGHYICKVFTNDESSNIIVEVYLEGLLVSGGGVVFAHAADEVVLNCSVTSHIPPDKLKVTWKRKDLTLVLLYQDGEVVSDASDAKYHGRVEFFTRDISKGDLSLRLKDIRTEDKGEYICTAYSGDLSANTTVVLKALGFSNLHITILILCTTTLLYTLGQTIPAWLLLRKKERSLSAWAIHLSRFLSSDILMGICFILWGVCEGSLGEASACATLNFVRFLLLMKTAPYLDQLPECFQRLKTLSVPAVYTMVTIVVLSVYYRSQEYVLVELNTMGTITWYSPLAWTLLFCMMAVLSGFNPNLEMRLLTCCRYSAVSENQNQHATLSISKWLGVTSVFFAVPLTLGSLLWMTGQILIYSPLLVIAVCLIIIPCLNKSINNNRGSLLMTVHFTWWIYIHIAILYPLSVMLEKSEDRGGLMSVMELLLSLTCLSSLEHPKNTPEVPHAVVYMLGASGPSVVNSIALMTELIYKSMTGQRNIIDLRVVVFLTESVFVICWISFTLYCIWTKFKVSREQTPQESQLQQYEMVQMAQNTQIS